MKGFGEWGVELIKGAICNLTKGQTSKESKQQQQKRHDKYDKVNGACNEK